MIDSFQFCFYIFFDKQYLSIYLQYLNLINWIHLQCWKFDLTFLMTLIFNLNHFMNNLILYQIFISQILRFGIFDSLLNYFVTKIVH